MVKNPKKLLTIVCGATFAAYGAKAIITKEMIEEGSVWRGAGWELHGTPAIAGGAILLALGVYIIYLAFKYE